MTFRVRVLREAGVLIQPCPEWHVVIIDTDPTRSPRYLAIRDVRAAPGIHLFPPIYAVQVVAFERSYVRLRGVENARGAAVVQEWDVGLL